MTVNNLHSNNHHKNFDSWNDTKKNLEYRISLQNPHEREIWWCSIGINLGHEEDGKNETFERPVLIVKRFNKDLCFVVSLYTKNHSNAYYFPLKEESFAILSQAKPVSTKRLQRYIGKIGSGKFDELLIALNLALLQKVEIPLARDFSRA